MRWLVTLLVCLTFMNSHQSFAASQRMDLRHALDALRQMGPKFCRNPGGLRDVVEIHLQNLGSRLWPLRVRSGVPQSSIPLPRQETPNTEEPDQCQTVRRVYQDTLRAFDHVERQVSRAGRMFLPKNARCERMFQRSLARVSLAVERLEDSYPEAYQVKDQSMAFYWRPELPSAWKEREDEIQSWSLDSFRVHTFFMNGVEWDLQSAPLDVNIHQDDLVATVNTFVSLTDLCLGPLEISIKGEATLQADFDGVTEDVAMPVSGFLTFQPDS